jgi:hypothetical protein
MNQINLNSNDELIINYNKLSLPIATLVITPTNSIIPIRILEFDVISEFVPDNKKYCLIS